MQELDKHKDMDAGIRRRTCYDVNMSESGQMLEPGRHGLELGCGAGGGGEREGQ